MPSDAIYRCSICGTEFRPLDAGGRRFLCCGTSLERVPIHESRWKPLLDALQLYVFGAQTPTAHRRLPTSQEQQPVTQKESPVSSCPPPVLTQSPLTSHTARKHAAPTDAWDSTAEVDVIEIIPPREQPVDALGAELMFGALGNEQPVSLEIGGDANGIKFLLRAKSAVAPQVQHQLQATYDQARFRPLAPEADPARADGTPCVTARMSLRRPCYLPLLTFRDGDFLVADPLRGLLGVFGNLREGERVLSQLILTPAPRAWADRYSGFTRPSGGVSGEPLTMELFLRQFVSVITVMTAIALALWAFFAYLQHRWLEFIFASPLAGLAMIVVIYLFNFALERSNVNPELVQTKIQSAAYDVSLRLAAFAPSPERADQLLQQLARAYRQYDLASGNALIGRRTVFNPQILEQQHASWWQEFAGSVTRLNVAELAALWHLPLEKDVPLVERAQVKRLLPLPQTVRQGIPIGISEHHGHRIEVHLPFEALWSHVFMVAKTQQGKSTLMAHLAAEAMRQPERKAVVVIDPHGDLVRSLLSLVPRERVSDVVYIDFNEKRDVIGLNLLDMRQGRDADTIVSNIVHVGELIWSDYWGPRMEDALRNAVRTLLEVNEKLVQRGERQFTLIDIPRLFALENFRHRLLDEFVTDEDILEWWTSYYEHLYESLRIDVINPVLTKIHRFSTNRTIRTVVGQSSSTINFREILNEQKILLVNTAMGAIGPDASSLLGAVLVDHVNFAAREQMAIPDPDERAHALVVVDEFQTIMGVDYPGLLAELQKMGASFILATQALGQLKKLDENLRDSIFSNIGSLFVFKSSAEDADFLRHELDKEVTETDIINLPRYACYLKTQLNHETLPTMYVQTLPPEAGRAETAEQILREIHRYTRPVKAAVSERHGFQEKWYGRELEALRKRIAKRKKENGSNRTGKAEDSKDTRGGKPTEGPDETPAERPEPQAPDTEKQAGASEGQAGAAEPNAGANGEVEVEDEDPLANGFLGDDYEEDDDGTERGQMPTANP